MQITLEKPVNAMQACAALGIGGTMMSALKRAMGIRSRYLFLSDVRRFMRKNPTFTVSQIYRPSSKPQKSDPTMKTSPQSNSGNHSQNAPVVAEAHAETTAAAIQKPTSPIPAKASMPLTEQKPKAALRRTSGSGSPQSRTARFIQKWKAERGNISRCAVVARSGCSSETIRRFERGISQKFSTFRRVAAAWGICGTDWHELLICRIKDELGDDAQAISIKLANDNGDGPKSKYSQEIVELYEHLDSTQQEIIFRALVEKDVIACLPTILHCKHPIKSGAADRSPSNKPEATHSLRCSNRARPRLSKPRLVNNDPWRNIC